MKEKKQISGIVQQISKGKGDDAANDSGCKIDGVWYNYSKYHAAPVLTKGQQVTLLVESDKFVVGTVAVTSAAYPTPQAAAPVYDLPPVEAAQATVQGCVETLAYEPVVAAPHDRGLMMRMAALEAVSRLYQGQGHMHYTQLITDADLYVAWLDTGALYTQGGE